MSEFKDRPEKTFKYANPFQLVWLRNIDRSISLIQQDQNLNNLHFIDVGCGSGVSSIYAARRFNFLSVSGFDFQQDLIDEAMKNLVNFRKTLKAPVDFSVQDAAEFKISNSDPCILFVFNSFSLEILRILLLNNKSYLEKSGSYLLLVNDHHLKLIKDQFELLYLARDEKYNVSVFRFSATK